MACGDAADAPLIRSSKSTCVGMQTSSRSLTSVEVLFGCPFYSDYIHCSITIQAPLFVTCSIIRKMICAFLFFFLVITTACCTLCLHFTHVIDVHRHRIVLVLSKFFPMC